jgi:DNA-binding LacI/PurR family transcriptional regulator
MSRWFFAALLEGLESVLRGASYDVLLYNIDGVQDRHDFFHRQPARRKVDAVVALAFPIDEAEQRRLELMGVTIVAAGGQHATYPYVCIDDETAGRQAMDHLIFLGHQRIAMIAAIDPSQPDEQPSGRSSAYYAALKTPTCPSTADSPSPSTGAAPKVPGHRRLLGLHPTAVYAHSDEVSSDIHPAPPARIPQDISVIGINFHPLADLADLTTVRQPSQQGGSLTLLLGLLRGEDQTGHRRTNLWSSAAAPRHLARRT